MIMRRIIYICMLLALPMLSMAQGATKPTKKLGDEAYAAQNYSEAIKIYESVLAEQGGSLSIYYNLGNAYYRDNQLGKAILNYERALRMDPADADSKANLEFVQTRIKDKVPHDEIPFYKRWWNSFAGIFSIDTWGIIGVIMFAGMLVALFFYFFRNDLRKITLTSAIICFLFTILANISAYSLKNVGNTSEAVIMDEMVIIKSSPDESGTELMKIHEGLKVKLLDEIKEWVKIEADNGNKVIGYIKATSLEKI